MAVTTYTSSVYKNNQPKFQPYADVNVSGAFKWTAAGTVGDILFLAKIPHGAKIVDFAEYHTNGQTAAAISFGFSKGTAAGGGGNQSILVSSGALATRNNWNMASAPLQLSLSDLDPTRYATLVGVAESGTFTIS